MALAAGISVLKKDIKSSEEDSFGLVGLASAGAIMAVLATGVLTNTGRLSGSLPAAEAVAGTVLSPFLQQLPVIAGEVSLALLPILVVFFLFQKISFKLSGRACAELYSALSLLFWSAFVPDRVNAGFLDVGRVFGREIVAIGNKGYVVLMGFALGLLTVLAEPAVYVLMHQIEEVTSGYIKKSMVLIFLSIGVACAVALSMLRIMIPGIQLWHYLLPGYIIAMIMTCITPNLFVGIAFDAGGVASGPMTATFILAFANGVAAAMEGADVLTDGFGMIAMVAMAPLIALQILGFIYKIKSKKKEQKAMMNDNAGKTAFELVAIIVDFGMGSKIMQKARKLGMPGGTVCLGRGTVKNRILDFIGLNEIRKEIILMVAEEKTAERVLTELNNVLPLKSRTMV